jgi:hypothetical protein
MHIKRRISIRIVVLLLTGVILGSCDRQKNMRGYDFIPDMVYSQAYETYSKNPNFKDSMTMRIPVTGTVPIGYIPFRYTLDSASRLKAGKELVNPFLPTDDVLARGKLIFTTFCIGFISVKTQRNFRCSYIKIKGWRDISYNYIRIWLYGGTWCPDKI